MKVADETFRGSLSVNWLTHRFMRAVTAMFGNLFICFCMCINSEIVYSHLNNIISKGVVISKKNIIVSN